MLWEFTLNLQSIAYKGPVFILLSFHWALCYLPMTAVLPPKGPEELLNDVSLMEGYLIRIAFELPYPLNWENQSKLMHTPKLSLLTSLPLPGPLYFSGWTKHNWKGRRGLLFNGSGLLLTDYFSDLSDQGTKCITYMRLWKGLCIYFGQGDLMAVSRTTQSSGCPV